MARAARGLTQEDFGVVSSRTYMSGLERGIKNPTLKKVDEIASVMEVHPLTLLTLAYTESTEMREVLELLQVVQQQVVELRKNVV